MVIRCIYVSMQDDLASFEILKESFAFFVMKERDISDSGYQPALRGMTDRGLQNPANRGLDLNEHS